MPVSGALKAICAGVALGLVIGDPALTSAGSTAAVIAPAAVVTCGGEPQPAPVECKTWKCTNSVWTLASKPNGSTCTDGNTCTLNDTCTSGKCGGTAAPPGTSCSDLNACTVGDRCDAAKKCIPGAPAVIEDGNPCTSDHCDPVEGVSHAALTNACCKAGLVQTGLDCVTSGCACSAQAQCLVATSSTQFSYDGSSSLTRRQVRLPGQTCPASQ